MIRTATGLHKTAIEAVDAEWEKKTHKMDWLGLETVLREIIRNAPQEDRNMTLTLISDAIACFTRRGTP